MGTHSRGQAEVLGTILLVGIVVTGSLFIMGVAMGAFGGLEEQTEAETIERTLLELRSTAADIAIEGEAPRTVAVDIPKGASLLTNETTTELRVNHTGYTQGEDNGSEVLYSQSNLGTVEIEHEGTRYALEGGGIFKLENGHSRLIAPPNFGLSAFTVNIPVLRVESPDAKRNPDHVVITPGTHIRPAFPNVSKTYTESNQSWDNPVTNGSIELIVQSEYYEGWAEYFQQFTDGQVTVFDDNQTVIAEMESLQELDYQQEITYSKDFDPKGNVEYENVSRSEFLPDNGPIIDNKIEDADDGESADIPEACGNETIGGDGCELTAGTYYFTKDLVVDGSVDIDTSGGDVELVIDGDFELAGNITVIDGTDNVTSYYVAGDFETEGGYIGTEESAINAHRNVLHIGGDHADITGNSRLDVVIYAPNAHVDISGTSTVRGAVMADELTLRGDAIVEYDSDLDRINGIDLTETETPIMYLHITENTATLDF